MNTAVSFELAKLLKDKGFDLECEYIRDLYNSGLTVKTSRKEDWNFKKPLVDAYSAPTIAEVVMWLYEKHSLWILPLPTVCGYFAWKIIDMQDDPNRPIERPPYNDVDGVDYRTPTEAYEAAISHALTNIVK